MSNTSADQANVLLRSIGTFSTQLRALIEQYDEEFSYTEDEDVAVAWSGLKSGIGQAIGSTLAPAVQHCAQLHEQDIENQ